MTEQNSSASPTVNLQQIKRRLEKSEELVVDPDGRVHTPEEPEVANKALQNKTVVKPSRWF